MLFTDITVEEWFQKYPNLRELDLTEYCLSCEESLVFEIPFISADLVGLAAIPCVCGMQNPGLVFIAKPGSSKLGRLYSSTGL